MAQVEVQTHSHVHTLRDEYKCLKADAHTDTQTHTIDACTEQTFLHPVQIKNVLDIFSGPSGLHGWTLVFISVHTDGDEGR